MPPRITSAKQVAGPSTSASSAPVHLSLLFIATSVTWKPALPLSLRKCPPKSPATTSSCLNHSIELACGNGMITSRRRDSYHPQFPNCSVFRQNTPSFWGNNESLHGNCIHTFCEHLACTCRQPRHRRRAASLRLLRRIFPHRTPVGRKTPRHSQSRQSPRLYAKALGAPAPRWLSCRQGQRRMDRRKIQGVRPRHTYRAVRRSLSHAQGTPR